MSYRKSNALYTRQLISLPISVSRENHIPVGFYKKRVVCSSDWHAGEYRLQPQTMFQGIHLPWNWSLCTCECCSLCSCPFSFYNLKQDGRFQIQYYILFKWYKCRLISETKQKIISCILANMFTWIGHWNGSTIDSTNVDFNGNIKQNRRHTGCNKHLKCPF